MHLEQYKREDEAISRRIIITIDEIWAKAYEPHLIANHMDAI